MASRRRRVDRPRAARRPRRPRRALPCGSAAASLLAASAGRCRRLSERAQRIAGHSCGRWARRFFAPLHQAAGGGFPGDTQDALWELVWAGLDHQRHVSSAAQSAATPRMAERGAARTARRSARIARIPAALPRAHRRQPGRRRPLVAGAQRIGAAVTPPNGAPTMAQQLLVRNGIVMRETAIAENVPGGYPGALSGAEDHGGERLDPPRHVRRRPGRGAVRDDRPRSTCCAACAPSPSVPKPCIWPPRDPANPYGSLLPWPGENHAMARAAGRERRADQRPAGGILAAAQSGDPRVPAGERAGAHARRRASWRTSSPRSRSAGRRGAADC